MDTISTLLFAIGFQGVVIIALIAHIGDLRAKIEDQNRAQGRMNDAYKEQSEALAEARGQVHFLAALIEAEADAAGVEEAVDWEVIIEQWSDAI